MSIDSEKLNQVYKKLNYPMVTVYTIVEAWESAKIAQPDDLAKRLRIKASMIEMGERIAFCSDSQLMREAADRLEWEAVTLTPSDKYAVADNIVIENRSKFDVVQDIFNELAIRFELRRRT